MLVVVLDGHVIVGACVSLTITVKLHIAVFFDESVAVHVTVVVPLLKLDPDAGEQATVGAGLQLSVAVGEEKVTSAVQTFGSVLCVMLFGHVIVGGVLSTTVRVNEQLGPEVVVQLTVVVPSRKNEPEDGTQVTVPHEPPVVAAG